MRIKSITISGLRSFGPEPVTLELGPRTVLIGPHGAGKSTVIMALEMLHAMASGSIHSIPCLQDEIHGDAVPDITVRAAMEGNVVGIASQVDIVITSDNKGIFGYSVSSLKVTKFDEDEPREFEFHGRTGWQYKEQAYEAREELDALLGIHKFCDPASLYPSSFFFGGHPLGEQLAEEFKRMYGEFKGFEKVNQLSMVPTVGIRETSGRLTLLRHLSVGMRTYLGLLAFLMTAGGERKGIMLIEEPDAGLHPDLLHHLAGVIKRASEHCQIVMTTNNPGMLSEFSETPEDVVVVERPFDHTELKRLERAPLEHWLKDYSLGHAWESGAIGGRMDARG